MHPLLNTAIKAARQAGQLIIRYADQLDRLSVQSKGRNDFVSEVDHLAEEAIIRTIHGAYPSHAILAEESGTHDGADYEWIIDPLDGTTNYLHGYPQYAISIAVRHNDELDQAVVYDPLRNELFTASKGRGAQLNDRRIRVSKVVKMADALLGTGFPFKSQDNLELWIDTFRSMLGGSSGVRRAGSAALDLAHVACGRLDGFWEFGLNPWDMAAGCLLIREAGGIVSDPLGEPEHMLSGDIVAANPKIYEIMMKDLKPLMAART